MTKINVPSSSPVRRSACRAVAVTCLGTTAAAMSAQAQTAPSAAAPASAAASAADKRPAAETNLDSVTVTATRRREPTREVPMQVNRLSTDQLEKGGAKTLTDYLAGQPGIDVNEQSPGSSTLTVRGVTTGAQTIATVGTYIDDVAFGSSSAYGRGAQTALDLGLLDLDHIEVLRGPQGTLYGAGAMGGLLKYVTVDPDTAKFGGKVSIGGSLTDHGGASNSVSALLNVPIKEDLAGMRISAFHDHDGGYVNGVGPAGGNGINSGERTGARVAVLLQPSDRMRVRLTALGQDIKSAGTSYVDYDRSTGKPVDGDLEHRISVREPSSVKIGLGAADIEYDFGPARLNAITSVQSSTQWIGLDYTGVYAPLLAGFGINVATVPVEVGAGLHKVSQELRLTSQGNTSLEWLTGLFYTHEISSNDQLVSSTVADGSAGPVLLQAELPGKYTEYAFYGDVTWKPMSRVSLTGGLRIAHNKQEFTERLTGALAGGDVSRSGDSADTSKTYLFTAGYALTASSNVYTRVASGYRPGGPNAVVYDPTTHEPLAPPTFNSDSLWSYEVGYKADLFDRQVSIESSLFDIEWKDLQQFTAVNGLSVIVNAGKARVRGAEFATVWRPASNLDLTLGIALIDARLSDKAPGLGQDGARLPDTAHAAANIGATYRFALDSRPAYAGITERFSGARNAGFDGSSSLPNYVMPGYGMTDLTAGIKLGSFDVSLYGRNIFDKRAQLSATTAFTPLGGPVYVAPARPRTIGLIATANF